MKVILSMRPLQLMQHILNPVIKHRQKRKNQSLHLKAWGKPKAELAQWLKEQAKKEANLPIYEKKIEDQLDVPLTKLRTEIPQDPKCGVKKNSEGKNEFWYG